MSALAPDVMRSRVLYELSQRIAVLLEKGIRGDEGASRVPVFLCHPLDPIEAGKDLEEHTVAVLYPYRITPEPRLRQAGMLLDPESASGHRDRLRRAPLWVRVRYALLVSGGSLERQLEVLAAAFATINDQPLVPLGEDAGEGGAADESLSPAGVDSSGNTGAAELVLVGEPEGWRELGLSEHRLTVSFEACVAIPSERVEELTRILDRDVHVAEEEP